MEFAAPALHHGHLLLECLDFGIDLSVALALGVGAFSLHPRRSCFATMAAHLADSLILDWVCFCKNLNAQESFPAKSIG